MARAVAKKADKKAPAKKDESKKKPAAKAAAPKKAVDKKSAPIKKEPKVDPKKKTAAKTGKAKETTDGKKLLELGLLCDCTSSMCSWIDRAKTTLKEIISNVVNSCDGLKVRVCFIGYRDHCDSVRFSIKDFTEDVDGMKQYIATVQAMGGGDAPEDVVGGLRKCLDQAWTPGSTRQVFLICDAPCHGRKYNDGGDSYPDGSPEGLQLEPLMREFRDNKIEFTCIKLNNTVDKMIKAMQENHPSMVVTDLVNATQTKSAAEVTKMFVDSASFILRAQVAGKGGKGGKGKVVEKPVRPKNAKQLWDPKKLAVDDLFSCISYLRVDEIDGSRITVKNHLGGAWHISKDLLEKDMWSADHFEKEVKCTMTDLSELIEQCGDTIFAVQYHKKIDPKDIEEKLKGVKNNLKKAEEVKKFAK